MHPHTQSHSPPTPRATANPHGIDPRRLTLRDARYPRALLLLSLALIAATLGVRVLHTAAPGTPDKPLEALAIFTLIAAVFLVPSTGIFWLVLLANQRALRRVAADPDTIVWTGYDPDDWAAYIQRDHRTNRWAPAFLLGTATLIAGALAVGVDRGPWMWGVATLIFLAGLALALGLRRMSNAGVQARINDGGLVLWGTDLHQGGVFVSHDFHPFHSASNRLVAATLDQRDGSPLQEVRLTFRIKSSNHGYTTKDHHVPIPPGHEPAAQAIVAQLRHAL